LDISIFRSFINKRAVDISKPHHIQAMKWQKNPEGSQFQFCICVVWSCRSVSLALHFPSYNPVILEAVLMTDLMLRYMHIFASVQRLNKRLFYLKGLCVCVCLCTEDFELHFDVISTLWFPLLPYRLLKCILCKKTDVILQEKFWINNLCGLSLVGTWGEKLYLAFACVRQVVNVSVKSEKHVWCGCWLWL